MKPVYFDSAATTQLRPEIIEKMTQVMQQCYGNASSTHSFGRSAKAMIEQARKTVAKYLNVSASEIVFTSGGTEADNLALLSAVRDLGVKKIVTSRIEHHAVLYTVQQLEKEYGISVDYVDLDNHGHVDYKHLESLLQSSHKTLVSLMHVNNEVGNILDMDKVSKLCKANNAMFHSDTVQSVGHYKLDLQELAIDFMAVSGHKFHGPKGVGFAFVRKNSGLKPLIFGGEQERGYRAGTEAVHNIVGLEEALKLSYENLEEERAYITDLKKYFIEKLVLNFSGVSFNGSSADFDKSTYTVLNVCLPIAPEKGPILLFQLDLKGIACSKGSACQSGSAKGSHVLSQILCDEDMQKPSIRFSFSKYNTKEEIDYVIEVLKEFI
ncbi:cysteine desulfurase family protein [Olleya sp. UBA1516]|uniref:cysteine desulfurase family protein n=1 Tax=Olleya sp. UBA1516 TaxID=1947013 RepID=UPI0025DF4BD2|nr:cysteine desulfurase family protein [Olleya sp. UBA1516]|tara:strand:+ start:1349 stop:2488 length:1140 start_codon:yes stop_codon:yes gene_type:complete